MKKSRLQFYVATAHLFALPLAIHAGRMEDDSGREGRTFAVIVLCFAFAWILWDEVEP